MTSQQVVSRVKYLFQSPLHDSKKAGHTGTLDPMATGLLPICLGEATKFSHYQLDADKSYQATILLGSQTDTGDADGQVIVQAALPKLSDTVLRDIAQQFLGEQQQIPPMYSALKKDGKKLYEYARAGIEIERAPRDITIRAIHLTLIDEQHLELTVTCSKGTYVRVLGEDIADALGTVGHLTALRRLKVGDFSIDNAIPLPELEACTLEQRLSRLLSVDACVNIKAELTLTSEQCTRVRLGQRLNVFEQLSAAVKEYMIEVIEQNLASSKSASSKDDSISQTSHSSNQNYEELLPVHEIPVDIRLLDEKNVFIGLGAVSLNGRLQPKKIIYK